MSMAALRMQLDSKLLLAVTLLAFMAAAPPATTRAQQDTGPPGWIVTGAGQSAGGVPACSYCVNVVNPSTRRNDLAGLPVSVWRCRGFAPNEATWAYEPRGGAIQLTDGTGALLCLDAARLIAAAAADGSDAFFLTPPAKPLLTVEACDPDRAQQQWVLDVPSGTWPAASTGTTNGTRWVRSRVRTAGGEDLFLAQGALPGNLTSVRDTGYFALYLTTEAGTAAPEWTGFQTREFTFQPAANYASGLSIWQQQQQQQVQAAQAANGTSSTTNLLVNGGFEACTLLPRGVPPAAVEANLRLGDLFALCGWGVTGTDASGGGSGGDSAGRSGAGEAAWVSTQFPGGVAAGGSNGSVLLRPGAGVNQTLPTRPGARYNVSVAVMAGYLRPWPSSRPVGFGPCGNMYSNADDSAGGGTDGGDGAEVAGELAVRVHVACRVGGHGGGAQINASSAAFAVPPNTTTASASGTQQWETQAAEFGCDAGSAVEVRVTAEGTGPDRGCGVLVDDVRLVALSDAVVVPAPPAGPTAVAAAAGGGRAGAIVWAAVAASGMALLMAVAAAAWWWCRARRRRRAEPQGWWRHWDAQMVVGKSGKAVKAAAGGKEAEVAAARPPGCRVRVYTAAQMCKATDNFSPGRFLGEGGFGAVYRADLPDGVTGAVKVEKLKISVASASAAAAGGGGGSGKKKGLPFFVWATTATTKSTKKKKPSSTSTPKPPPPAPPPPPVWDAELTLLQRLHHKHLVNLIGLVAPSPTCAPLPRMLVFEYLPNGTLAKRLHTPLPPHTPPLRWLRRTRILYQVASALAYLHHASAPPIVHRDVKSANVLLTAGDAAKLADFGLSKEDVPRHAAPTDAAQDASSRFHSLQTAVRGSLGYVDPHYARTGLVSPKTDVWAFGVVVLEVVTGQRAVSCDGSLLARWALDHLRQQRRPGDRLGEGGAVGATAAVWDILDLHMVGTANAADLGVLVDLADMCLREDAGARPSMQQVVEFMADRDFSGVPRQATSATAAASAGAGGERGGPEYTPAAERRRVPDKEQLPAPAPAPAPAGGGGTGGTSSGGSSTNVLAAPPPSPMTADTATAPDEGSGTGGEQRQQPRRWLDATAGGGGAFLSHDDGDGVDDRHQQQQHSYRCRYNSSSSSSSSDSRAGVYSTPSSRSASQSLSPSHSGSTACRLMPR